MKPKRADKKNSSTKSQFNKFSKDSAWTEDKQRCDVARVPNITTFAPKLNLVGRILAIDYGKKRVGIAVTDPLQMIATRLTTVPAHEIWTFLTFYL